MPAPFTTPVAQSVPFEPNRDPGFGGGPSGISAENVQDAIEEAKVSAVSTPRFCIVCTFNGTVSNNQWLGYDNLLPGNDVPVIIPVNCVLREVTFSNQRTGVDGNLELFKNGFGGGNIFATLPINNIQRDFFPGIDEPFTAGDFLVARWDDEGNNPNDLGLTYFFQVVG